MGGIGLALVCVLGLAGPGLPAGAAEYVERHGAAEVRVEGPTVEGGQVRMRLADVLVVTYGVEGKSTLEVEPVRSPSTAKEWELRQRFPTQRTVLPDGRVRWEQHFRLVPTAPGDHDLPLAPLRFREDRDAPWQDVVWKPVRVSVTSSVHSAELGELRDGLPIERVPEAPGWGVPTWTLVVSIATLIACLALVLARRRRRRRRVLSPTEWARAELARLSALEPSSPAAAAEQFAAVADVVRRYLELYFRLPAPEQTTAEFLETMQESPQLSPEQRAALAQFLSRCDLVKFARVIPAAEEIRQVTAAARSFVEQAAAPAAKESRSCPADGRA